MEWAVVFCLFDYDLFSTDNGRVGLVKSGVVKGVESAYLIRLGPMKLFSCKYFDRLWILIRCACIRETSLISIPERILSMALVNCIECGSSVSDKAPTCPRCGVSSPSGKKLQGTLLIRREHLTWVARALSVEIFVDRTLVGKVWNGEELSINLPIGRHELTFSDWANGSSQDRQRDGAGGAIFQINTGETTVIQIRYGMRGITITSSSNLS